MSEQNLSSSQLQQLTQWLSLSEAEITALLEESRANAMAEVKKKLTQKLAAEMLNQLADTMQKDIAPPEKAAILSLKQEIEAIQQELDATQTLKEAIPSPASSTVENVDEPLSEQESPPEEACYVYGIISAEQTSDFLNNMNSLVPNYPLESVVEGNLQAIISKVPWAEFGTAALEENLHNQQWLSDRVRRNQQILQHILQHSTLIPMRFCTIFYTEDDVRTLLTEEAEDLEAQLSYLHQRQEWGVKVFADVDTLQTSILNNQPNLQSEQSQINQVSNGTAYFMKKKLKNSLSTAIQELSHQLTTDSHAALSAVAVASTTLSLQNQTQNQSNTHLILNAAYLIDETALEQFTAKLDALAGAHQETGLQYELSGPWPPFNFVGPASPLRQMETQNEVAV